MLLLEKFHFSSNRDETTTSISPQTPSLKGRNHGPSAETSACPPSTESRRVVRSQSQLSPVAKPMAAAPTALWGGGSPTEHRETHSLQGDGYTGMGLQRDSLAEEPHRTGKRPLKLEGRACRGNDTQETRKEGQGQAGGRSWRMAEGTQGF